MPNSIELSGNAYPYSSNSAAQAQPLGITGSILGAQNAAASQFTTMAKEAFYPRDNDMVGVFKIFRAEDGFVIKCSPGEGYIQKTYVANDIDEALNKAKVYLVTEALNK